MGCGKPHESAAHRGVITSKLAAPRRGSGRELMPYRPHFISTRPLFERNNWYHFRISVLLICVGSYLTGAFPFRCFYNLVIIELTSLLCRNHDLQIRSEYISGHLIFNFQGYRIAGFQNSLNLKIFPTHTLSRLIEQCFSGNLFISILFYGFRSIHPINYPDGRYSFLKIYFCAVFICSYTLCTLVTF